MLTMRPAASYFKSQGYTITQFRKIVGNGGAKAGKTDLDIVMEKAGTVYAFQAKSTAEAMSIMADNTRWARLAKQAMPNAELIYVHPAGKAPAQKFIAMIKQLDNRNAKVMESWLF